MTDAITTPAADVAPFLARRSRVLLGWARNFRYPESWYSQSDENRRIARAIREDAWRQVQTAVARAREQEAAGDVSGASATIAGTEVYAHTLQMIRNALEDDRSRLSVWVEEIQTEAAHALEAVARGVSNVGTGITDTAILLGIGAIALLLLVRR